MSDGQRGGSVESAQKVVEVDTGFDVLLSNDTGCVGYDLARREVLSII